MTIQEYNYDFGIKQTCIINDSVILYKMFENKAVIIDKYGKPAIIEFEDNHKIGSYFMRTNGIAYTKTGKGCRYLIVIKDFKSEIIDVMSEDLYHRNDFPSEFIKYCENCKKITKRFGSPKHF